MSRATLVSLLVVASGCERVEISSPAQTSALSTPGGLADPDGGVFRSWRSPLNVIAPEDPPIPNRGLVSYIPMPGVALPDYNVTVGKVGNRLGLQQAAGVPGSALGNFFVGGSFSSQFGSINAISNGGNMKVSNLGVGAQGWTVAFWAGLPTDKAPRSVLSTLTFTDQPQLQVFADTGAKQLTLVGGKEVKVNATFGSYEYHHVAIVFTPVDRFRTTTGRAPGTLAVFFDGQLVGSQNGTWSSLSEVVFGSTTNGKSEVLSYALLDDIFVYRTSLASSEVLALYRKAERGIARVWPTSVPVDVKEETPYVQTHANSATSVPGTFAFYRPGVEQHDDEPTGREQQDINVFTLGGWYFVPPEAPTGADLFFIRAENQPAGSYLVRLAVSGTTPFAEVGGKGKTDRVTGGSRFIMRRGEWHFVALTHSERAMRLYVDSELTGEITPTVTGFSHEVQTATDRVSYGLVPMAWTVLLSREASPTELEALRTPGPHVWLPGSSSEAQISTLFASIGASGFTGPLDAAGTPQSPREKPKDGAKSVLAVVPNDYGALCVGDETGFCSPVAIYGGAGGVSVGKDNGLRLNKDFAGQVQILATPVLQGDIGVSFNVFLETNTQPKVVSYPLFARDFPTHSDAFSLPYDVRVDAVCGATCFLRVAYPVAPDSAARHVLDYPVPSGKWVKLAFAFNQYSEPFVAVDGVTFERPGSDGVELTRWPEQDLAGGAGWEPRALAAESVRRLRFGYDMAEYNTSADGGFDIADMRVYGRPLSPIELTTLTGTCETLQCQDTLRGCLSGATPLSKPICASCVDTAYSAVENNLFYGLTNSVCLAKGPFAAVCASDAQCEQGVCFGGFCGSNAQTDAEAECAGRKRTVEQDKAGTDRYKCGGCLAFHAGPADKSPVGACVWKPPKKSGDVVFTPGGVGSFDTYECDSGHAVTTVEPKFSVLPDHQLTAAQQADANTCKAYQAAHVTVDTANSSELRSRCTPAMPDGCAQCERDPKPDFCTASFVALCQKTGCKVCEKNGQTCAIRNGYPTCATCRANFHPQRALLTPAACAKVFGALHGWNDDALDNTTWNDNMWGQLFSQYYDQRPIIYPWSIKALLSLGWDDFQRSDYARLEKAGVGFGYAKFGEADYSQFCTGSSICTVGGGHASCVTEPTVCHNNFDALYKQATAQVGGKSLKLHECVLPDSAFWSPYNDEICVATKNPKGASCPPINPQTKLPETGNGDQFCETGYCGKSLGVCTDGGVHGEKVARKDGAQATSSDFDVGLFSVNMSNEIGVSHSVSASGRTSVSRFAHTLTTEILGFVDIELYQFAAELTTDGVSEPEFSPHYTLLGIPISANQEPVASCVGGMWSDEGKWEGSGKCEINLEQGPPPPKLAVHFPVAEKAKDKLTFERIFAAGPIPITVRAAPIMDVGIGLDAGFSKAELEGRFGVKPAFAVGVELNAGIGAETEKGGIKFGVMVGLRAALTLLELALPAGWVTKIEQEKDENDKPANRFSIVDRQEISIEFTLLNLALSIFAEIELGVVGIEWEYTILELKDFTVKKSLLTGPKQEFILDVE